MKAVKTELKTRRLCLTLATEDELAAMVDSEADEHLRAAYGEMLAGAKANPEQQAWYAPWRILRKDGTPVGSAGFMQAPQAGTVEIGYGVDEPYRRQGYASEAVKALCAWAFEQPDVYFVEAQTEADNAASLGVLGKCGFTLDEQGTGGRRFVLCKPDTIWLTLYMSMGLTLGIAIGTSTGNVGIGLALGMCAGLALGSALDASEKKKRQAAQEARAAAHAKEAGDTVPPARGADQ